MICAAYLQLVARSTPRCFSVKAANAASHGAKALSWYNLAGKQATAMKMIEGTSLIDWHQLPDEEQGRPFHQRRGRKGLLHWHEQTAV